MTRRRTSAWRRKVRTSRIITATDPALLPPDRTAMGRVGEGRFERECSNGRLRAPVLFGAWRLVGAASAATTNLGPRRWLRALRPSYKSIATHVAPTKSHSIATHVAPTKSVGAYAPPTGRGL